MMLGALPLVAGIFQQTPTAATYPDPLADRITVQAMISLPELTPREETAFRAALESIMEGTEEYSKTQLKQWTRQTGVEPKIEMMPGFARIGLSFPKGQFSTAASMIESLIRRPKIDRGSLEQWKLAVDRLTADPWSIALWPDRASIQGLRFEDPHAAYKRYVTWGSVTLAIGGAVSQTDALSLARRFSDWKPTRLPPVVTDYSKITPLLKSSFPINSMEIALPEFDPIDESATASWAAVFALGVGKGSSLFRVLRDELGYSYRHELVLWPTDGKFKPRILILRKDGEFQAESVREIREILLKAVQAWTPAEVARASGMVRSSWLNLSGPNPLYLSPLGPLTDSVEDQTFLKLFWKTRTGSEWDPDALASKVDGLSVAHVQQIAAQWLESGSIRVILGARP